MGRTDGFPLTKHRCGNKKDSRPLVPGPQRPGKLHAALASHADIRSKQVKPLPFPHHGFHSPCWKRASSCAPRSVPVGYPPTGRSPLPAAAPHPHTPPRRTCAQCHISPFSPPFLVSNAPVFKTGAQDGCRKRPQHTAGRCEGYIVPVKWVVKLAAITGDSSSSCIRNIKGQRHPSCCGFVIRGEKGFRSLPEQQTCDQVSTKFAFCVIFYIQGRPPGRCPGVLIDSSVFDR